MSKDWLVVSTKYGSCIWGSDRMEIPFSHEMYVCGTVKPNYPVPAIRQGFEWGRCLTDGDVVLLHWHQGRY